MAMAAIPCLSCGGPCEDPQGRTWCQVRWCTGHASHRCKVVARRRRNPVPSVIDLCVSHANRGGEPFRVLEIIGDAPLRIASHPR